MRDPEHGWDTTVEDICTRTGLSTATFYASYRSRNEVCLDSFIQHVVVPLEEQLQSEPVDTGELSARIEVVATLLRRYGPMIRGALIARLDIEDPERDIVRRLAKVLLGNRFEQMREDDNQIVQAFTLWILDQLAGSAVWRGAEIAVPMNFEVIVATALMGLQRDDPV